jgi:DNA mismatch endonuclease (patch repair protein)
MSEHESSIRSKIMSSVGQKNTAPELLVRKFLFNEGFRYRINVKKLSGSPDIVLHKYKSIVFVHGCFWHGHENCTKSKLPKSNVEFWENKRIANKSRDKKNIVLLKKDGWKVFIVWECEIKDKAKRNLYLKRLAHRIEKN